MIHLSNQCQCISFSVYGNTEWINVQIDKCSQHKLLITEGFYNILHNIIYNYRTCYTNKYNILSISGSILINRTVWVVNVKRVSDRAVRINGLLIFRSANEQAIASAHTDDRAHDLSSDQGRPSPARALETATRILSRNVVDGFEREHPLTTLPTTSSPGEHVDDNESETIVRRRRRRLETVPELSRHAYRSD